MLAFCNVMIILGTNQVTWQQSSEQDQKAVTLDQFSMHARFAQSNVHVVRVGMLLYVIN